MKVLKKREGRLEGLKESLATPKTLYCLSWNKLSCEKQEAGTSGRMQCIACLGVRMGGGEKIVSLLSYQLIKWGCFLGSSMEWEWVGGKQLPQVRRGMVRKDVIDYQYACIKIFSELETCLLCLLWTTLQALYRK